MCVSQRSSRGPRLTFNDEGGINRRSINPIFYDDSYRPPKTVEQVERLVGSGKVPLLFSPLGTALQESIGAQSSRGIA